MHRAEGSIRLSASDLVGHLNCKYLTRLNIDFLNGVLERPRLWDPLLQILRERGMRHEQGFLGHLQSQGFELTMMEGIGVDSEAVARTRDAMLRGGQIIVQGALQNGQWVGRADVLQRVETSSDLGPWSYEVIDTKLARETKGGTVLQLCLYADLVKSMQGRLPEFGYVVAPWSNYKPQAYRMDDYSALYRRVRRSLEEFLEAPNHGEEYPEPKDFCAVCGWRAHCEARRRADDHLSLVAGISKLQTKELQQQAIKTVAELAAMPLPLAWKPERGSAHAYERVREQARIQVEGRNAGCVLYELLRLEPGLGLAMLPEPSAGDVFFDLEGDPFAGEGGLEYLFGYACRGADGQLNYSGDWVFSRSDEKKAFGGFIDFIAARLNQYPELHIYHFAPYEPAALKRLMGRHATREEALDRLLRGKVFVDLYSVVRHALRASVESYSIKRLEPLYGFLRAISLPDANNALARVEACLEFEDLDSIESEDRATVEAYNRDDCISTLALRDWLEEHRAGLIAQGVEINRPTVQAGDASEAVSAWQERINDVTARLTGDLPDEIADHTAEQRGRWLLANILDWHRRENKAVWWEYFRLAALSADELFDEKAAISGLEFIGAVEGTGRLPVHRYRFLPQDTELRGGEMLFNVGGEKLGTVRAVSLGERVIDIRKRKNAAPIHPEAVYAHEVINTDVLAESLMRLGEHVATHGIEGDGRYLPARDLLLRKGPRLGGHPIRHEGETTLEAALRIAPLIEGGILPIQGPPGTGKSYTGARMICALVRAGKRVGITANSHKVIRNLLDGVVEAAMEMGVDVQCIQKADEREPDQERLRFTKENAAVLSAIGTTANVAGGTAWLWARPDAAGAVDVLFIDEAAQLSLANALAVSQAANTLVLLGDPRQLEQPMQGSHPEGTEVSALDHILAGHQTISADQGLFLDETWRLHPEICGFTSELFYERRLGPRPGLERQNVIAKRCLRGTGLQYFPVPHEGNQSASPEEADRIRDLVEDILAEKAKWIDRTGEEHELGLDDILIIAPYNAQVFELKERLPEARIGTVDKFQGQQAPIVIYSMTTSTYADAPRGMEFLYSLNRLNVATSRAQCLCILVASPSVFDVQCRTPRQMQLANAFCRYLEVATVIE